MILSIIIPLFNEEKTIEELLNKVYAAKLPMVQKEIVVIDDCSSDRSGEIVSKFKKNGLKYFRHSKNSGKGAAIRTGIANSAGDVIIIQDADLEYDPVYYDKLLEPILKNDAQVVYGSRLINYPLKFWGNEKTILPTHLVANKFLTYLTNLLYGSNITDMETGYKLFKRDIFKKVKINSDKFDFEAEVTARILKAKIPIVEIPISVTPRTYDEGKKITWRDGLDAIWTLIKYRFVKS